MYSVTQFIKSSPLLGLANNVSNFVKISGFHLQEMGGINLSKKENIHPSIIGIAVDYLTRTYFSKNAKCVFDISLRGAELIDERDKAEKILEHVNPGDIVSNMSVIAACKLSTYDVVFRAGKVFFKGPDGVMPDAGTIENVKALTEMSIDFLNKQAGEVFSYITFSGMKENSYISSGDADYMTLNLSENSFMLWDLKSSKLKPTAKDVYQVMIYALLIRNGPRVRALNSCSYSCIDGPWVYLENVKLRGVGFLCPRRNEIYQYLFSSKDEEMFSEISNRIKR